MTPADSLDALEAVARAATQGEWYVSDENVYGQPLVPVVCYGSKPLSARLSPENATHVATFDPPTVLELIAQVRKQDAALQAVRELHGRVFDANDFPACRECCDDYPCPTIQALDTTGDTP